MGMGMEMGMEMEKGLEMGWDRWKGIRIMGGKVMIVYIGCRQFQDNFIAEVPALLFASNPKLKIA